jgi:hypothetical protein
VNRDELDGLYRSAVAELSTYPGVVGVGFGLKQRAGRVTDERALRVYVAAKKSVAELRTQDLIPRAVGESRAVSTDVVVRAVGAACSSTPDVFPGDQITRDTGNSSQSSGTLGLIVTKVDGGQKKRFILTNAHVLEGSLLEKDRTDIYKPEKGSCNKPVATARFDPGFVLNTETFKYSLFPALACKVDATLANIMPAAKSANINKDIVAKIPQFGPGMRDLLAEFAAHVPADVNDAKAMNAAAKAKNIAVKKFGAVTNYTGGLIVGICTGIQNTASSGGQSFRFELVIAPDSSVKPSTETHRVSAGEVDDVNTAFDPNGLIAPPVTCKIVDGPAPDQKIVQLSGPVFATKGDSGSIVLDAGGQIVGLFQQAGGLSVYDLDKKKSVFLANGLGFAQFIFPAFEAMGLTPADVVPPGAPQAGAVALASEEPEETPAEVEQRLFDAAEATFGHTPAGRRLLRLARMHLSEIRFLLHHRRRVSVAWHRNKGPAYMAAIARTVRHPGIAVPDEIDGVRLAQAMQTMRAILFLEGSAGLKESLAEHGDWLMSLIERATGPDDALRILIGDARPVDAARCLRLVNAKGIPGTASAVVRAADGTLHLLTSHHVLFGGGATAGEKIFAVEEQGGRTRMTEIATSVRGRIGRVMHDGEPVFVDCALAALADPVGLPESLRACLKALVRSGDIVDAAIGAEVTKDGAATGRTTGRVVDVAYPDLPTIDGRRYDAPGQLLITPLFAEGLPRDVAVNFCTAGDSGAAVRDAHGRMVGLIWGANANGEGIMCPIRPVLETLAVEPATSMEVSVPMPAEPA